MSLADAVALLAATLVLAAGLVVTMPVPWGGRVPLGLTLALALPALLPAGRVAAVDGIALVLALAVLHRRGDDRRRLARLGLRFALAMSAGLAAAAGVRAATDGEHVLAVAAAAAAAVLVVDLAWGLVGGTDGAARLRSALPVHLTLACAGVLFAVAVDEVGVAMASVAAFPLLLTRIAFQRYADATATLEQTVQALGLVPELAGLAPLGHSERAARYAAAVAIELGFDPPGVDRIVTATRLHHLGAVRHEDADAPTSPTEVATSGARILRESGFPGQVADLLQAARADGFPADAPSLDAAIIRVATTFDHVVLDDPTAVDRGLALLSTVSLHQNPRRAAAALLAVVATNPDLVVDVIAAGERFRDAADGLDLELVAAPTEAHLLPFTHRPQ
ncbi:MAG: phosphohydrolase [Actinomycetia bacterium]|nr:phosphohydrolase [Actinomycetes bacterium]